MPIFAWGSVQNSGSISMEPMVKLQPTVASGDILIWDAAQGAFVNTTGSFVNSIQSATGSGESLISSQDSNNVVLKTITGSGNAQVTTSGSSVNVAGATTMVTNMTQLNALTPITGQQVFVAFVS